MMWIIEREYNALKKFRSTTYNIIISFFPDQHCEFGDFLLIYSCEFCVVKTFHLTQLPTDFRSYHSYHIVLLRANKLKIFHRFFSFFSTNESIDFKTTDRKLQSFGEKILNFNQFLLYHILLYSFFSNCINSLNDHKKNGFICTKKKLPNEIKVFGIGKVFIGVHLMWSEPKIREIIWFREIQLRNDSPPKIKYPNTLQRSTVFQIVFKTSKYFVSEAHKNTLALWIQANWQLLKMGNNLLAQNWKISHSRDFMKLPFGLSLKEFRFNIVIAPDRFHSGHKMAPYFSFIDLLLYCSFAIVHIYRYIYLIQFAWDVID